MTCQYCAKDDGNYDMSRRCCRVRFLMHEPRLESRRAWIARWENKYGDKESAALKEEFARQWSEKYGK